MHMVEYTMMEQKTSDELKKKPIIITKLFHSPPSGSRPISRSIDWRHFILLLSYVQS